MNISTFSAWVPLLAWLLIWQRGKQRQLRVSRPLFYWVAGYFLLSALSDLVMFTLAERHINNLWVAHLYLIPSSYLVLIIYQYLLPHVKSYWFYGVGIGFFVFKIIDWWFFYPSFTPTLLVRGLIFSVFSLWLYRIPSEDGPPTRTLSFWTNYAFSLYFFGNLALFTTFDVFFDNQQDVYVWGIHAILNISKGLLVAIGILLIPPVMRPS